MRGLTPFPAMSSLIFSYLDDNSAPSVISMPGYTDAEGDSHDPQILVEPWSLQVTEESLSRPVERPGRPNVALYFSVAEAEVLARKLLETVEAAKNGAYSEAGKRIVGQ